MNPQTVFKRYELKYLLTPQQKQKVLEAMSGHMQLDEYGRTIIRNIYYDTDNFRLIRASLERPLYKEKLRVRSYDRVGPSDKVFIEIKKKYDGVVYKRRIHIPEEEAMDYLAGSRRPRKQNQITEEIDYFLSFYKELKPKVFLTYEREAYYSTDPEEFRVTFDENILWRETGLSLQSDVYGMPILSPEQTLMELKTPGAIPLWMVKVLSEEGICKTTFSKYGNAYRAICNRDKNILPVKEKTNEYNI